MKYQKIITLFHMLLTQWSAVSGNGICSEVSEKECVNIQGSTRCYFDYPQRSHVGFEDAKEICKCNKLQMVMAQDEYIMRSMVDINFDFWLDLQGSQLPKFTFVQSGMEADFTKGDHLIHKALRLGEQDKLCAYIVVPGGRGRIKFKADRCTEYRQFLCRQLRGNSVTHNASYATWYQARHGCYLHSGDLAYSDNAHILQDLIHNVEPGEYWIGLHKEKWTWGDGTEMIYSYWDTILGQPSTSTENCVISKSNHHALWTDVSCSENSGVLCFRDDFIAGDIPRHHPGQPPYGTTPPTARALQLSKSVVYALVAISCICVLLIVTLGTVLGCSCSRQWRRGRRRGRVPDYCEIDELAITSYNRTRTRTVSTDIPPEGTYEACGYLAPISATEQPPEEPVYSVIDNTTRKDSSGYLTLM